MFIPLKVDVPTWRTPWVNYALIAVIVAVSIAGFADEELAYALAGVEIQYPLGLEVPGLEPSVTLTTEKLPLPVLALTSSFLHVGLLHLAGNMLFLWVFGNAINYKFGHLGYVGLYLLAALCAGLAHYGFEWFPYMGASGAVNGVMGAFLVFFPRNDVTVFWVLWYRPGVSRISSGWVILFWIVWDVFTLVRGGGGQVALWAHVGGFAIGFLTALLCVLRGWIKPTEDEETLFEVLRRGR